MSVQKYVISKGIGNFTTIPNIVLQNLNNYEALGLYCYIVSLPNNWEFHKDHLSNHSKIGRDKITKLLKILEMHELIKIVRVRGANGQFMHADMHVSDGSSFKIIDLEEVCAPCTEKPLTVNHALVNSTYKENNKKLNKELKTKAKRYSASDDAHDKSFEEFWSSYPIKKNKKRTRDIWKRKKYGEILQVLLSDVQSRLKYDPSWSSSQFIPHPSTYLRNERWKDELNSSKNIINFKNEHKVDNEIKQTAKFYGPGHPTWDRLHTDPSNRS